MCASLLGANFDIVMPLPLLVCLQQLRVCLQQPLPAPMTNELLFHADARLAVPAELSLEDLQQHLETLADELMVELRLQPAE